MDVRKTNEGKVLQTRVNASYELNTKYRSVLQLKRKQAIAKIAASLLPMKGLSTQQPNQSKTRLRTGVFYWNPLNSQINGVQP